MTKKKTTKVQVTKQADLVTSQHDDIENIDLKRTFSELGTKVHVLFSRLPKSLQISKKDAVDMYKQIDHDARIRSHPYWLFIIASCGIATLGLIINSPAVIIGAMLVSPLMSPIIGLGMGVAINDIYLGSKSIVNIVISLLVSIFTSALISFLVPIREPTSEILARTNPTVLDLFIALFCGLVAALSSVRSNKQEVLKSVAPGAAIGVALMPPICVIGFALGNGFNLKMMWGSFLLFMTNLIAILIVSSVFYYFIYNQYSVRKLMNLVNDHREKEETFYNGRFKILWLTWNDHSSSGYKRFIFPAILIILISYPLTSSLLFLKKKIRISQTIVSILRESTDNLQIIRGTEQLVFTDDNVSGNILYSSNQTIDAKLGEKIKKNIDTDYPNYDVQLNLIRIANTTDLVKLTQKNEVNLETSKNTMHDPIRHAYARDLVQRALDLLQARFPAETGIINKVEISFLTKGMNKVFIYYFAPQKHNRITGEQLGAVFKNELRTLQANINHVELIYSGTGVGNYGCTANTRVWQTKNSEMINKEILKILDPLNENSWLRINLMAHQNDWPKINKIIPKEMISRVHLVLPKSAYCLMQYSYY